MNQYINQLKECPEFDNSDFIEGLKAGLDASSQIADDLQLRLAGLKEFDELYDFVLDHSNNLAEK